jgi:DnaJ family protein C protein 9
LFLVKKAYRQLALRYHPDRTDIDQKEEAKTKFQIIGKIYAILSDDEKRKIYDDTGMKYLPSIIPIESIFRCYG